MENELKKDFTRRLSQCNSGEMIVIIYDIFFAYVDDIRQAHCKGDHDGQKDAIRNAQSVLDELIGSLNFSYPISHNLYKLYMFCKNELSRAMYENLGWMECRKRNISCTDCILFVEVAKQDKSAPLMKKYPAGICRDDLCARCRKRGLYGCGQSPGIFCIKFP